MASTRILGLALSISAGCAASELERVTPISFPSAAVKLGDTFMRAMVVRRAATVVCLSCWVVSTAASHSLRFCSSFLMLLP